MQRPQYNISQSDQLLLPLELPAALPLWRPIHYLGSKLRLAEAIVNHVERLSAPHETVCDLFAGSGTAALALSSIRKVVAADIQEYSRVLCSGLLNPATLNEERIDQLYLQSAQFRAKFLHYLEPLLELEEESLTVPSDGSLLCEVSESGLFRPNEPRVSTLSVALEKARKALEDHPSKLVATTYFGGAYFSYRQAFELDCLLLAIDSLGADVHDTCLSALLSTASTVVNSIGKQFAQPMRARRKDGTIKVHLLNQMRRDRSLDVVPIFFDWLNRYSDLPNTGQNRVVKGDFREVLRSLDNVSLVYADPPYTRDHYSRFYHVLETLSLRDSPKVSTTALAGTGSLSRGAYRDQRHQSPFCIKSQAPDAFRALFLGCRNLGASALVSYSPYLKDGHPRLMTIDAVVRLAKEYFRLVEVEPAHKVTHSKLNRTDLHLRAAKDAEVFIICKT